MRALLTFGRRHPRRALGASLPTVDGVSVDAQVAGWSHRTTVATAPAGPSRFFLTGADGDAIYHDRRTVDQSVQVDRRRPSRFTDEYRAGVHAALTIAGRSSSC